MDKSEEPDKGSRKGPRPRRPRTLLAVPLILIIAGTGFAFWWLHAPAIPERIWIGNREYVESTYTTGGAVRCVEPVPTLGRALGQLSHTSGNGGSGFEGFVSGAGSGPRIYAQGPSAPDGSYVTILAQASPGCYYQFHQPL